jgi:hypothetical protein
MNVLGRAVWQKKAAAKAAVQFAVDSFGRLGRALARRRIRVLSPGPRLLSLPSTNTPEVLRSTVHGLDRLFRSLPTDLLHPKPPFKSHSAPRPPQTQRLPPSLLIENASDRVPLRRESVLPEAFPIKPSDNPGTIALRPRNQMSYCDDL